MKMKKRIISLILSAVMCLGLLPETVLAAGGEAVGDAIGGMRDKFSVLRATSVSVSNSYRVSVPLLNRATMNDRYVQNEYVFKNNGLLNGGKNFQLYDWNRVNMYQPPQRLSDAYSHEFLRNNNDSTWRARYAWYFGYGDSDFLDLVHNGQISFLFSADLKYDRHIKLFKHAHTKKNDLAVARLYSRYESNQYMELANNMSTQSNKTWYPLSSGWTQLPTSTSGDLRFFFWHTLGDVCWDGDSGVRKAAVAFADTVAPYVTSVSVSGNQYYYNSGSFDFTVYFNEPIRLANGASSITLDDKTRVKLAAYDRETRESQDEYAQLTEIGSNWLKFHYEVPSGATDIVITGLADRDFQRQCILSRDQELKMLDINGNWSKFSDSRGEIKVNSVFTDIAGNGIDEAWRGTSFPHEIHVDNIAPEYENSVIESGSMIRNQDQEKLTDGWNSEDATVSDWTESGIDRSQVFAGVDDWINLVVDFDEELKTFSGTGAAYGPSDAEHFTATLNVLDESGENIKLKGSTIFSIQSNVNNNRPMSRLRFQTLAITQDMKPDPSNLGPIKILSVTSDTGNTVYDMCGNPIDLSGISFHDPDKQEWLDTVAPKVQMGNAERETYSDAGGVPTYTDGGVCIPVQALENSYSDLSDIRFRSGTAGVGMTEGEKVQEPGSLTLSGTGGAKLEYAVTTSKDVPGADKWQTITGDATVSFPQIDGQSYLHLRMAPDSEIPIFGLDIQATGYDFAGNKGTDTTKFDQNAMTLREHALPTSSANFSARLEGSGQKYVSSSVTVSDMGGLEEVWYKLENHNVGTNKDDSSPVTADSITTPSSGDGWTKVSELTSGTLATIVTPDDLTVVNQENNFLYLCIYAKDRSGNVHKAVYNYRQDMRMPGYNVVIPSEIKDFNDPDAHIQIGLMNIEDAKDIGPVNTWGVLPGDSVKPDGYWAWDYGALFVTLEQEQDNSNNYTLTKLTDWLIDKNSPALETDKPVSGTEAPGRDESRFTDIDDLLNSVTAYGSTIKSDVSSAYRGASYSYGWRSFKNGAIMNMITKGETVPDINYEETSNTLFTDEESESKRDSIIDQYNPNGSGAYYGNLNIYLTQTASQFAQGDNAIGLYQRADSGVHEENAKVVYVNKHTVKVKMDDGNVEGNPINKVTFYAPVAANGQALASVSGSGFDANSIDKRIDPKNIGFDPQNGTDVTAFKTLAGVTVPFTVGNNRVPEWGIEDINFAKSKVRVYYAPYDAASNAAGNTFQGEFTEVGTFELAEESADQAFVFPDEIGGGPYKTGVYKVVVELATKSFEHTDSYDAFGGKTAANGGFLFRVVDMEPTEEGGIYYASIFDGREVFSNKLSLDALILDAKFDGGSFNSDPLSAYTIPMIENISVDGVSTFDYYYPFFTYQNRYANDESSDALAESFMQLKVWEDGKEDYNFLTVRDRLGIIGVTNVVNMSHSYGFSFCAASTGAAHDLDTIQELIMGKAAPGDSVTICMQEYYANGETGSIKKLTVSVPEKPVDGGDKAHITPNVDVTCSTGAASKTVSIGVNDISSLYGVKDLYMQSGGLENWDKNLWSWATIDTTNNVSRIALYNGAGHSVTVFGDDDGDGKITEADSNGYVINELLYGSGCHDGYAPPVIIVRDVNYNATVREIGDLVQDWDYFAPAIYSRIDGEENQLDAEIKDGGYTAHFLASDAFTPKSLDDMILYISTVNPETTTGDGDESDKETGVTNTVAIPFSDFVKAGQNATYNGSTPNTPGVTGISWEAIEDYEEGNYGADWSYAWQSATVTADVTVTGSVPPEDDVYIYCVDELGHRSNVLKITGGGENYVAPKVDPASIKRDTDGTLMLDFTQAVVMVDPEPAGGDTTLTTHKTGLPIYADGKYTVQYMDIFGNVYSEDITVALDGNFKFTYSISPEELTNKDVTLKIDTQEENGAYTEIESVVVEGTSGEGTGYNPPIIATDKHSASVVMHENGTVKVTLKYGGETKEKLFKITNIDKVMDPVKIAWEYNNDADFKVNDDTGEYVLDGEGRRQLRDGLTETSGYVTAVIHIKDGYNDELIGTNGELRYTFPNYSEANATYTFQYMDAAGNTGNVTATLPYAIKLPIPPRLYEYGMKVSHTALTETYDDLAFQYNANAKVITDDSDEGKAPEPPAFSDIFTDDDGKQIQAKEIFINLSTNLNSKVLILPYGTTANEVTDDMVSQEATLGQDKDGNNIVVLNGKNIRVTQNTEFTIAIVEDISYYTAAQGSESQDADKSAQKVYVINVKIDNIPVLEPVSVYYEKKTNFEWWAYFDPMDNVDENGRSLLTVTNAMSDDEVKYDPTNGRYYHVFKKSGKYTFYYQDDVGHLGSIVAEVNQIPDNTTPSQEEGSIRWWPYEGTDESVLRKSPVNFDVTVQMTFNMLLTGASLSTTNERTVPPENLSDYDINVTLNNVTVTFHKNSPAIYLYVEGETGETAFIQLDAVNIIDKVAPDVDVDFTDKPGKYNTITFTPNEPVLCNENPQGGYYDAGNPMKVDVTANGTYTYTFIDKAGNTVTKDVTVTMIDREAPTVVFSDSGTGDGQSWDEYAAAKGEAVKTLTTVQVKANEDCEYTFQGKTGSLTKDTWAVITIDRAKGGFAIVFTDGVGNATTQTLSGIILIDTVAPKLFVSPQSISIVQGTDGAELDAAIKAGVEWSDNMSAQDKVKVTYDTSRLNSSTVGEYVVYITATDEQGNSTMVERYVRIYNAADLMLRVKGSDETRFKNTGYMNTTVVTSNEVTFEVTNLRGSASGGFEPFIVYVKKGMKTPGQMKNGSGKASAAGANSDGTGMLCDYTFDGTGYYTVYVVTQDRDEYLTYLYIEQ